MSDRKAIDASENARARRGPAKIDETRKPKVAQRRILPRSSLTRAKKPKMDFDTVYTVSYCYPKPSKCDLRVPRAYNLKKPRWEN